MTLALTDTRQAPETSTFSQQPSTAQASGLMSTLSRSGLAFLNTVICRKNRDFTSYGEVADYLGRITPINYSWITTKRIINYAFKVMTNKELFNQKDLLTLKQKLHRKEIKEMKELLCCDEDLYTLKDLKERITLQKSVIQRMSRFNQHLYHNSTPRTRKLLIAKLQREHAQEIKNRIEVLEKEITQLKEEHSGETKFRNAVFRNTLYSIENLIVTLNALHKEHPREFEKIQSILERDLDEIRKQTDQLVTTQSELLVKLKESKLKLTDTSTYANFSAHTADLVHALFPKALGETMKEFPTKAEEWLLYRAGSFCRFVNYEFDRATTYRDWVSSSDFGHALGRLYCAARTHFAHLLLHRKNVTPFVNIEHLLLRLSTRLKPEAGSTPTGSALGNVILQSISESIALWERCEKEFEGKKFHCPNCAFIARLVWYKQENALPKPLPDPDEIGLDCSNLNENIKGPKNEFLDVVAELILEKIDTKKRSIPTELVHWLIERKRILKKVLSLLIGELVINQVTDPHLFGQKILFTHGIEVADFEIDGFGQGKKGQILKVGKEMLEKSLEKGFSSYQIQTIFQASGLKANQRSGEGINQKEKLQEELEKFIYQLLRENIKGEDFNSEGFFKNVRKTMQGYPIVDFSSTVMHICINTITWASAYLFRDHKFQDMEFGEWMFRALSGTEFYTQVTHGIMDFIYNPAWHFIVSHLLETLTDYMQNKITVPKEEETKEHMRTVFRYAFFALTKHMPVKPNESFFESFATDEALDKMRQFIKPSGKPFVETIMECLLPTIKELKLYYRLVESFRKGGIHFDGDSIFWDHYVRQYLNDAVDIYKSHHNLTQISINDTTKLREKFIDILLKLDSKELRSHFSKTPDTSPLQQTPEAEIHLHTPTVMDHIQENDYLGAPAASSSTDSSPGVPGSSKPRALSQTEVRPKRKHAAPKKQPTNIAPSSDDEWALVSEERD